MRAAGLQIAYEVPLLLSALGPVMIAGSSDSGSEPLIMVISAGFS